MCLFLLCLLAISSFSQSTGGSVRGVLTDDSGAVIPAAVVTITGNGAQKSTQSQGDGTYAFNNLAPGKYTVRATVPGFAVFEKPVTVGSAAVQLPIEMRVTAEKQEITVSTQAAPRQRRARQ